ncbi:MAG: hypothetical protein U1B80_06180 [Anaerolineaceae bacterium]|nr:hypothetical protein [Anaerolineaceae bacterium]
MQRFHRALSGFLHLIGAFYDPQLEQAHPWIGRAFLTALYLAGAGWWGKFLNWGRIPFGFHDWAEISAARMEFVRNAILAGKLPLHMTDAAHLRGVTDRFMAIPDAILSPQALLLGVMDVGTFFLVNTLILYTLGGLGLLALRRRFRLSLAAFTALFLLFNFNGHILAHTSVGHATWGGYFLFPWLAVLIFQLMDGERGWRWVAKTSLLLFFIYLQGSFHHFVWALFFLGFLGITSWKYFAPVFKAMVFGTLLSLVRILPPALELAKFDREFLGGYPSVVDILQSMVVLKFPAQALEMRSMLNVLGWWEFNLYVGVIGAAFVFYFGVYRWLKNRRAETGFPNLLLPVAGVAFLSLGRIYRIVMLLQIPLISGERASIRMLILPFVVLLIIGAVELQRWLDTHPQPWTVQLAGLMLIGALGHDLWQHLKAWQVSNAFAAFPYTPVDLTLKLVGNRPDPPYIAVLSVGAVITTLTLIFLGFQVWRERKRAG